MATPFSDAFWRFFQDILSDFFGDTILTSPQPKARAIQGSEIMEEDFEWDWNQQAKKGDSLKVELDKPYTLSFESAEIRKSTVYTDKNGKPKIQAVFKLTTLNGTPSKLSWTTGSWTVMGELKRFVKDPKSKVVDSERFKKAKFFLLAEKAGANTKYTFKVSEDPLAPKEVPFA